MSVTEVRRLTSELEGKGYPGYVIMNEVYRREFGGFKVIRVEGTDITFSVPERKFNTTTYDKIREIAEELNFDFVPELRGFLGSGYHFTIHLKRDKKAVASLKEDRVIVNSTHPEIERYLERILKMYSEPQEKKEKIEVRSLREIVDIAKELEPKYPEYVVRQEIYDRIEKFKGRFIVNFRRFSDTNYSWAVVLGMPMIEFNKEAYDKIRNLSERMGLTPYQPKDERGREKILLGKEGRGVVALDDRWLGINAEHPDADECFEEFSKIYEAEELKITSVEQIKPMV